MGIVAEAPRRCGGSTRSELDCGWQVGHPILPKTLDEGLDVVVVVVVVDNRRMWIFGLIKIRQPHKLLTEAFDLLVSSTLRCCRK